MSASLNSSTAVLVTSAALADPTSTLRLTLDPAIDEDIACVFTHSVSLYSYLKRLVRLCTPQLALFLTLIPSLPRIFLFSLSLSSRPKCTCVLYAFLVRSTKLGRPTAGVTVDGIDLQPVGARRRVLASWASGNASTVTVSLLPFGGPNNVPVSKLTKLLATGASSSTLFALTGVSSSTATAVCGNGVCESGERPDRCPSLLCCLLLCITKACALCCLLLYITQQRR